MLLVYQVKLGTHINKWKVLNTVTKPIKDDSEPFRCEIHLKLDYYYFL